MGLYTTPGPAIATRPVIREPKLLDRFGDALHQHNYIPALVHDYVDWGRRFIFFHNKRHPNEMGMAEVNAFIDNLRDQGGASMFQRDEALRALRFLYAVVLEMPLVEDERSAAQSLRVAANLRRCCASGSRTIVLPLEWLRIGAFNLFGHFFLNRFDNAQE